MTEPFDIVVVGSGAAGIAAAVSAARAGRTILLLDQSSAVGGTGGFSGLTTLCGLFDEEGNFLNAGFSREFSEALMREDGIFEPVKTGRLFVQLYRPASFRKIAAGFLAQEPRVTICCNAPLKNVIVRENRIISVNGTQVRAAIDCTGTAEVGRAVGEELLVTDETTQAPAVIFPLKNIESDFQSPLTFAQLLSALERAGFPPISFMPCADAGVVSVKFSGTPENVPRLIEFLRNHVSGFENCRAAQTEFPIARRSGAMIAGRYLLTGADVLGARKFPDAVVRCNWPVEQWSAHGKQTIRYLPRDEFYEIPARSLRAARTENLFMAGKSASADGDAMASARVMGCCLATGAAAGKLAAEWLKSSRHQ